MTPWPPGIFVVGTDTGVGKTRVAAAIARTWVDAGLRVGVVKPVSTGGVVARRRAPLGRRRRPDRGDLDRGIAVPGRRPMPGRPVDLRGPARPAGRGPAGRGHARAGRCDPRREASIGWWAEEARVERLVIEGVGGLLCPLAEGGWTVADLAIHLDYPLLIVAHRQLGTLNQILMTVEAARLRGLRIAGVILNAAHPSDDPLAEATNAAELAALLASTAVLADWEFQPANCHVPVAPEARNWIDLALVPRHSLLEGRPFAVVGGSPTVLNPLVSSDDDLLPDAATAGLLGTGSVSVAGFDAPQPGKFARGQTPLPDLASLGLDLRSPSRVRPPSASTSGDDERGYRSAPSPWRGVLLTSYASAVSLALIWTLYQHRGERKAVPIAVPTMANDLITDRGRLGDRSKRVEALKAIPAERVIKIGQAREVGLLRVEPIAIERKNLLLERVNMAGKTEKRDGGKRALLLRVRLTNLSTDQIFAPVDPAFVRVHADSVLDTLLEMDDGRKIYPDPLAVDSEWTVAGESFADLRPGQSREVGFMTEANAPPDVERQVGTWRIKLRTGLDSTAVIGVRLPGASKP